MLGLAFLSAAMPLYGQQQKIAPGLSRLDGVDKDSGITYTRLFLEGRLVATHKAMIKGSETALPSEMALPSALPPVLTAQCTATAQGKQRFELLANFGGVDDSTFYPPFKPSDGNLFPPELEQASITMEFLGYTHVPPVKRRWEAMLLPQGQYRYNPPSRGSANLEDSTYYLRLLLALPTLRLTLGNKSAEFFTSPLLDQVRKEPLCTAAKL